MLDVRRIVRNALISDPSLISALGGTDKVVYFYPNDFESLPIVTIYESDQSDSDFSDDMPYAARSEITIDVWTRDESTATISGMVDTIMGGILFTKEFSSDVPEADSRIFHRVIRYSRKMTADELDIL